MKERFGIETADSITVDTDALDTPEEYRTKKPKKQAVVVKKKRKLLDNRPNPEQEAAVAETVELSKDMDTLVREGISKAHKAGNRRKKQELMGSYAEIEKKLDSMPIEVIERANTRLKTARSAKKQKKDEEINKIQENLAGLDAPMVPPEEIPVPVVETVVQPEIIAHQESTPVQTTNIEEETDNTPIPSETPASEIVSETPITFEATPHTVKRGGFLSSMRAVVSRIKSFISQVSQKESVKYYQTRGLIDTETERDNEEIPESFIRSELPTTPIEKTSSITPEISTEPEAPLEISQHETVAWEGDWEDDDRPEGYTDIEDLHEAAQTRGFDANSALGEGFLENYIHTVENAKKGSLTASELSELISKNAQFHEALNIFKKQYQASHPRKSRKILPSPDTSVADKVDTLEPEETKTEAA